MESGSSNQGLEGRPLSPKKKLKPSSTTNSETPDPKSYQSGESKQMGTADSASRTPPVNGTALAPTRSGRRIASSSSDTNDSLSTERECFTDTSVRRNTNTQNNTRSIQEEEVSSSENSVTQAHTPSYTEGNADSLSNGEPDGPASSLSSEASAKV